MLTLGGRPLNARIRGDQFEIYTADGTSFLHPDDVSLRQQAEQESSALIADSLRDQKRIRNFIAGFFAVAAAIGYLIGKSFERT